MLQDIMSFVNIIQLGILWGITTDTSSIMFQGKSRGSYQIQLKVVFVPQEVGASGIAMIYGA
jgi:hypothetical protein